MNKYVIKISMESTTYLKDLGFYSEDEKHFNKYFEHLNKYFEYFSINLEKQSVISHTSHDLLYQEVRLISLAELKAILRDKRIDNILNNE